MPPILIWSYDDVEIPGPVDANRTAPIMTEPGPVGQSIVSPTADPLVASLIWAWSNTFMEINHEIISMVILLFPLIQEGLLSVT